MLRRLIRKLCLTIEKGIALCAYIELYTWGAITREEFIKKIEEIEKKYDVPNM